MKWSVSLIWGTGFSGVVAKKPTSRNKPVAQWIVIFFREPVTAMDGPRGVGVDWEFA